MPPAARGAAPGPRREPGDASGGRWPEAHLCCRQP